MRKVLLVGALAAFGASEPPYCRIRLNPSMERNRHDEEPVGRADEAGPTNAMLFPAKHHLHLDLPG